MPNKNYNLNLKNLPPGWDYDFDFDGKIFFLNHFEKITSWVDPRDRLTKPATFADCVGNELPHGWEQAYDPLIGVYYIDHINQRTQIEDPHLSWRAYQEAMLRDYLSTASEELKAKKETLDVKTRRLGIAEDEYQHLNAALNGLHTASSTSSLTSTSSSRYDPDLLKQDVSLAKLRVQRLRQELEQVRQEVSKKQQGLRTLTQVEQKLSSGNCYTVGEAQAIMNELRNIQRSLLRGKKERAELMQNLATHKEDFTRLQTAESSPDVSTLSILEKFSTASQTDLIGELVPLGARLAEMGRLRLQYDESRKEVQHIQRRLSELEESVEPGEVQSDKDRLLLFQEKEQLLRELRSICPKSRPINEMAGIHIEIQRLEKDLSQAAEMAKKNIADRLRLHEEKQNLLHKLRDALNSMAALEGRLKSLSASTLSMSSSSSLASLSSSQASSKGSLSSLSFTDIYGSPSAQPDTINMADLHRRVERLLQGSSSQPYNYNPASCDACDPPSSSVNSLVLQQEAATSSSSLRDPSSPSQSGSHPTSSSSANNNNNNNSSNNNNNNNNVQLQLMTSLQSLPSLSPRSSLSSVSPPISPYELGPPPSYEQAFLEKQKKLAFENPQLEDVMTEQSLGGEKFEIEKSGSYSALPPLSPISEYVPNEDSVEESQEDVSRLQGSSSGTNTSSSESVAGDSGVFEASNNRKSGVLRDLNADSAQIQIKLRYAVSDGTLHIGIERARNLNALFIPENHKISIKAALLPNIPGVLCHCSTKLLEPTDKMTLGEDFPVSVPLAKLNGKTLQINVYGVSSSAYEHCLGCSQVSLADFSPDSSSTRWYNVLSFHFLQMDTNNTLVTKESSVDMGKGSTGSCDSHTHNHKQQESDISTTCSMSGRQTNLKEESSDESTIISSQTSTLTRNRDGETLHNDVEKWHQRAAEWRCAPEEALNESGNEDQDQSSDEDDEDDDVVAEATEEEVMEEALECAGETAIVDDELACEIEMEDKSTNTECVFVPTKSDRGKTAPTSSISKGIVIKRSQTFSPSAVVNKNEYVCRLNRSDSDSSMPLYRKPLHSSSSSGALGAAVSETTTFQRGSLERRSIIRWKKMTPTSAMTPVKQKSQPAVPTIRTSIDLELDRQAQQCRLQSLQEEIRRLKALKEQLEEAKAVGDSEKMNSLLADERLQDLFHQPPQIDPQSVQGKESLKVQKLLKKTSREIYKLRKSRTPRGKPDLISFKEKMAFFTHPGSNMIPSMTMMMVGDVDVDQISEETFLTGDDDDNDVDTTTTTTTTSNNNNNSNPNSNSNNFNKNNGTSQGCPTATTTTSFQCPDLKKSSITSTVPSSSSDSKNNNHNNTNFNRQPLYDNDTTRRSSTSTSGSSNNNNVTQETELGGSNSMIHVDSSSNSSSSNRDHDDNGIVENVRNFLQRPAAPNTAATDSKEGLIEYVVHL